MNARGTGSSAAARTKATSRAHTTGAGASQSAMREHNLGLVLEQIVDATEPVSRADLAVGTGLTRATVSALVDLLVSARMVHELEPVARRTAGRPAVPLVPARGTIVGIGLEVNVDYLGARAIDLAGNVLAEEIVEDDFRHSSPHEVLPLLGGLGSRVVDAATAHGARVAGACLALPGIVDRDNGPLRLAPNLGWADDDLSSLRTVAPFDTIGVRVANEANLAAVAEIRALHAARPSFLYVSGEVGIGGALVDGGVVFKGDHGWSGELGHVTVDPNGPDCTCGAEGCLETYAGKDSLMAAAGLARDLPVEALIEAARLGDTRARDALARGGRALGIALSSFMNLTDINEVVLGGIYSPLTEWLVDHVHRELHKRVLTAPWVDMQVKASVSGTRAAMSGAALSVLRLVVANPGDWGALDPGAWSELDGIPAPTAADHGGARPRPAGIGSTGQEEDA